MSHTLTELDEFTAEVIVPDGTDTRNNAAGDVEQIAQALANRTKNLNDHSARTDVANVWNQGQQFDITNAAVAMIQRVNESTGDNVWRNELEYKINNSLFVRMYSGNGIPGAGGGMWIITWNARWQPGTGEQMWTKDDPGRESNMLRCIDGELHFYGKGAGGASWGVTGWDTGRGILKVGDTLDANHVRTPDFQYPTPLPTRWVQCWPDGGTPAPFDNKVVLTPDTTRKWQVRAPHGAAMGQVNVKVNEAGNTTFRIGLWRTTNSSFSDGLLPVNSQVGTEVLHSSGTPPPGVKGYNVNFNGLVADNERCVYWVMIECYQTSPSNLDVLAVQASYTDPGPRNH